MKMMGLTTDVYPEGAWPELDAFDPDDVRWLVPAVPGTENSTISIDDFLSVDGDDDPPVNDFYARLEDADVRAQKRAQQLRAVQETGFYETFKAKPTAYVLTKTAL